MAIPPYGSTNVFSNNAARSSESADRQSELEWTSFIEQLGKNPVEWVSWSAPVSIVRNLKSWIRLHVWPR